MAIVTAGPARRKPPSPRSSSNMVCSPLPAVTTSPFSLPDTGNTDVAVFWDFENVKIPEWCPAVKASDCLREKLLPFGRIVERKLYYDSSKKTEQFMDRSDLDLSGFTLVDCPS